MTAERAALGRNDGADLLDAVLGAVGVIVDHVVVLPEQLHFLARARKTPLNDLLGLGSAVAKAPLLDRKGGGQKHDQHRLGIETLDVHRSLDLDLQNQIFSLLQDLKGLL